MVSGPPAVPKLVVYLAHEKVEKAPLRIITVIREKYVLIQRLKSSINALISDMDLCILFSGHQIPSLLKRPGWPAVDSIFTCALGEH